MANDDERCKTCRYHAPMMKGNGECRRYPPTVQEAQATTIAPRPPVYWPEVSLNDWCGEYQARIFS